MRKVKTFDPEKRWHIEDNFYCSYCGNTHQWQIDVRLRHIVELLPMVSLLPWMKTKMLANALQGFVRRNPDKNRF